MTAYSAMADPFVGENLPPRSQWPTLVFDRPELQYPERMNVGRMLEEAVDKDFAGKPAIFWGAQTVSYGELLATANRIARILVEDLGLVPGNRVLLHAPNRPDTVAAWFAVLRAGGVVVSTMPLLRPRELRPIIEKARISHALVDFDLAGVVAEAGTGVIRATATLGPLGDLEPLSRAKPAVFDPVDTASEDPALIAFTSGTTGKPKGCVHFHRDVRVILDTFCRHLLQPLPSDVFCATPPFAFTFGLGGSVIFPLATGASTAIPERPGYDALMQTLEDKGVSILFTAPTAYRALLQREDLKRLGRLRICVSAGEPLSKAVSDAWFAATGIRIIDGIGSTEMMHIFISASGDDIRPGSTGRPVPGFRACVLDQDDNPAPQGSVGRLAVQGPTGCRYLADERQADYVIKGWNVTGDVYSHDEDGYFTFLARADDMIVSSGYNIGAPEVEQAILLHPKVAEAAVIGAPDPDRGQVCKAFIVLHDADEKSQALLEELQDFVKKTIAPYKYPRLVEFVAELPRTETGKLQRYRLRQG